MFDVQVERLDDHRFRVLIEGIEEIIDLRAHGGGRYSWLASKQVVSVSVQGALPQISVTLAGNIVPVDVADSVLASPLVLAPCGPQGSIAVRTPIPGRIVRVLVKTGDDVPAGGAMVIVEAMKMENEIRAPRKGVVAAIKVGEGDAVDAGQELLSLS